MSAHITTDTEGMAAALTAAQDAAAAGEVPIGAVITNADGVLLGSGYNRCIQDHDPTAHAEVMALRAAGEKSGNYRLTDAVLYVTLEPCLMCVGAIVHARLARVVFGASDPKAGCLGGAFDMRTLTFPNHRFAVTAGVCEAQCAQLLTEFFQQRR